MTGTWAAVVLAGGGSRRMGTDKLSAEVGGVALLDRVLSAVRGADDVVAVGPERPTELPVRWCREEPVGGGPAAALGAGLRQLLSCSPLVAVLAGELPLVYDRTVD